MHLRARIFLGLALSTVLGIAPPAHATVPNYSVTSIKIVDGQVMTADLANNAVTSAKIQDGQVTNADIGANAVTADKIQDSAVSDAKILSISGSKVSGTVSDADTVDGKHATEFAPAVHAHGQSDVTGLADALVGKTDVGHVHSAADITTGSLGVDRVGVYAGLKIVHKGVADGVSTFDTIGDALDSITDASLENRYIVKIMPGDYAETLTMKESVDVQGSGTETVSLRYTGNSNLPTVFWNVSNAVLSNLTIKIPLFGYSALRVYGGSAILRDVRVIADVMPPQPFVVAIENAGELLMERCTLRSSIGKGLYSYGSLIVSDSSIEVSGGGGIDTTNALMASGSAVLRSSQISANSPVRAAAVNITGGAGKLSNCDISATGASLANGVQASNPGVFIDNSRIEASSTDSQSAHAVAGFGVRINGSSLTSNGYAFTGTVDATNCVITQALGCLHSGSTARIAGSQIFGGSAATIGVERIVNCYDEDLTPILDVP